MLDRRVLVHALNNVIGRSQSRLHVAALRLQVSSDISARMKLGCIGKQSFFRRGNWSERLIVHFDKLCRSHRDGESVGRDRDKRLSDVTNDCLREYRRIVNERADIQAILWDILSRENALDARQCTRLGHINAFEFGVRTGSAQKQPCSIPGSEMLAA